MLLTMQDLSVILWYYGVFLPVSNKRWTCNILNPLCIIESVCNKLSSKRASSISNQIFYRCKRRDQHQRSYFPFACQVCSCTRSHATSNNKNILIIDFCFTDEKIKHFQAILLDCLSITHSCVMTVTRILHSKHRHLAKGKNKYFEKEKNKIICFTEKDLLIWPTNCSLVMMSSAFE